MCIATWSNLGIKSNTTQLFEVWWPLLRAPLWVEVCLFSRAAHTVLKPGHICSLAIENGFLRRLRVLFYHQKCLVWPPETLIEQQVTSAWSRYTGCIKGTLLLSPLTRENKKQVFKEMWIWIITQINRVPVHQNFQKQISLHLLKMLHR